MTSRSGPGQILHPGDGSAVAVVAAERISAALVRSLGQHAAATLALSGGRTPRDAYALLAKSAAVDWSRVHVFMVDERAVPPTHERSNYRWAKAILLDHVPIPAQNVHRMRAEASDLAAAAREYEACLRRYVPADADDVPALDVAVMGIGDDGHTASLFPGEPTLRVTDRLVASVPAAPGREARMTITRPVIEHAQELLYIVVGQEKRNALDRVFAEQGDLEHTPARIVRGCRGRVQWVVDDDLFGKLNPSTYGSSP
jgi:6-phosphogluconolactonase